MKCDFQLQGSGGYQCSKCGHWTLEPYEKECAGERVQAMALKQERLRTNRTKTCCGGAEPPKTTS